MQDEKEALKYLDEKTKNNNNIFLAHSRKFVYAFLPKALLSYIPLTIFSILYAFDDEMLSYQFIKGLMLALSYVFISQVNNSRLSVLFLKDFLFSANMFFGVGCLIVSVTKSFQPQLWMFWICFIISAFLMYLNTEPNKATLKISGE